MSTDKPKRTELDYRQWSLDTSWTNDPKLKAVVFFDENHGLTRAQALDIKPGIMLLAFPHSFKPKFKQDGKKDLDVLISVINFIKNNEVLVQHKVKLFFCTMDKTFKKDSPLVEKELQLANILVEFIYIGRPQPGTKRGTTAKITIEAINFLTYPEDYQETG